MNQDQDVRSQEMQRLEQAAEGTAHPEEIRSKAANPEPPPAGGSSPWWFVPYLAVAIVFGGGLLLLDWEQLPLRPALAANLRRYLLGGIGIVAVLTLAKALHVFAIARMRNAVARFNLTRVLRLSVILAVVFIVVPVLFVNWYAAAVSLGLISLILGFALQTPISSFIGWVYILIRAPYRVGDRIQIGDARGDVIDVGYLDTTLWEIGGRHLSTDHPSGRLIKFPNTNVFNTPVFNYSWPLFPYIWNEIKFNIAYESDLEFVATTMQEIAEKEIGEVMMEKVKVYRDLLARTPVNDLDVQERPGVVFRVSENTWLEAIVRYLVHPKESGRVKSGLTVKLLAALNTQPNKVSFPKGNAR